MFEKNATLIQIIESWKNKEDTMWSMDEILDWIAKQNESTHVAIEKIEFEKDGFWYYDKAEKGIVNRNRSFFKITGLKKYGQDEYLEQPIIVQNEIGYLGIICKEIKGVLYFLMQAKIEPGNINKIQISPTIQATKSNFMQAHGGREPAYLEYFRSESKYEVIVDQIQSEQSSRFYGKRNRNIIIKVEEDIQVLPSHKWMTLGQIKELMKIDNLVNMDTRTVIASIPFALRDFEYKEILYIQTKFQNQMFSNSFFSLPDGQAVNRIYQYMNEFKMLDKSQIQLVDLYSLESWRLIDNREFSKLGEEFKVVYCDISIDGREVKSWRQPLLEACGIAIFGLIYTTVNNKMKFLVQTISEVGCFDRIEIGPSVQIGAIQKNLSKVDQFFLEKYNKNEGVVFSKLFSEEGGRFYHEQNRNVLMYVDYRELEKLPNGYFWVDFASLNTMIQFNNCLNIQLRNLLSIFDF